MQDNPYGIEALWLQGDMVIRCVALVLLIMSVATWSIILYRSWRLWKLRKVQQKLPVFWQAHSIDEGLQQLQASQPGNPYCRLVEEGVQALQHHHQHRENLQAHMPLTEWLADSLRGANDESTERLQRGLSVLASVGATAPFIGLFGTVWGIYHALVSIGVSGQASIDKVAGPVGEALIMTALGLAVAIPAVLGYNALVRMNRRVISSLTRFARQLHCYFLTGAPPVNGKASNVHELKQGTASGL